jgi:murein DD-endopeptidase MepM/ murein hydrolase activator NlpD
LHFNPIITNQEKSMFLNKIKSGVGILILTSLHGVSTLVTSIALPNSGTAIAQTVSCGGVRSVNFSGKAAPEGVNIRAGAGTNFQIVGWLNPNQNYNFDGYTYGEKVNDRWTNQPDYRWYKLAGQSAYVASAVINGNAPGSTALPPSNCVTSGSLHNNPTTSNPLRGFSNPLPAIYGITQAPGGSFSHKDQGAYAIDFATPKIGTSVFAMRAGKIIRVVDGYPDTGGDIRNINRVNYVAIEHENGYVSLYLHLQQGFSGKAGVQVGNTVNAGSLIGYSGNSGFSNAQHLHVEVDKGGVFQQSVPFEIDGVFRF